MRILVINSGSFSFKYKLFGSDFKVLKEGNFPRIRANTAQIFKSALEEIGEQPLDAIGHRVVHGGKEFYKVTKITNSILRRLSKYSALAPLHNPYNLEGIKTALRLLPSVDNFAVFDTAFFKDLPDYAKVYAIPLKYYQRGIQRFGFHGTSHKYAAQEAARLLQKPLEKCNLITIHLGGGCSITAIKNGHAIDTSMGFTPLEGLVMGTRCGDIDAGIILKLMREEKINVDELDALLNKQSGIKGLSGYADFRDLLKAKKESDTKSQLAFDVFVYRIKKYIGAYFGILNRIDAIVFTGAIGSGRKETRDAVVKGMDILKNVEVFSIKTDEELAIVREVFAATKSSSK